MGIIENASVTLEKIVEADGRVPSSLIKAEFDKIMTTGVIPTHRELYGVIKANTG